MLVREKNAIFPNIEESESVRGEEPYLLGLKTSRDIIATCAFMFAFAEATSS